MQNGTTYPSETYFDTNWENFPLLWGFRVSVSLKKLIFCNKRQALFYFVLICQNYRCVKRHKLSLNQNANQMITFELELRLFYPPVQILFSLCLGKVSKFSWVHYNHLKLSFVKTFHWRSIVFERVLYSLSNCNCFFMQPRMFSYLGESFISPIISFDAPIVFTSILLCPVTYFAENEISVHDIGCSKLLVVFL